MTAVGRERRFPAKLPAVSGHVDPFETVAIDRFRAGYLEPDRVHSQQ